MIPPGLRELARERLESKLGAPTASGCREWQGATRHGYGYSALPTGKRGGWQFAAHRVAYELAYGPIPRGGVICHRCDNPPCCEPTHLFLGTQIDNIDDMNSKGRAYYPFRANPPRGEKNVKAKLTLEQVLELKRLRTDEGLSFNELGRRFGITKAAARFIVIGKNWAHAAAE